MKPATSITIGKECIKCGRCVLACPCLILSFDKSKNIKVNNLDSCIGCGHCAAICPTHALQHSLFPPEKIKPINFEKCPTPEATFNLIKKRRSNRLMSDKPIPQEYLDKIIEAARYAPTARNIDDVEYTIVSSKEKLKVLTEFTISEFQKVVDKLTNPILKPILKIINPDSFQSLPKLQHVIEEYKKGNDVVLRRTKSVILFHSKANDTFTIAHQNMSYQNASLMAESLGVAQFYLGYMCSAIFMNKGQLEKELGIDGKIGAAIGLGMPISKFENFVERETPKVKVL
ncbi:4Fe-4S dicluster domain-containing protein [Histomonas meleagridis]|uniref:4Fe-4S dicluster domain-containing protein n=1 Tax=Histomonas meleagridis TaxID=135588 RepID=UPI003559379E|nr:4Fe-4S dicluster domain-containing protein [Histomonas meleagridis]KAH0799903.1 4Fe-4S dicluster domain-containing protein [Histomonas meleagridis]